jgi:WD40 repeat protein
MPRHNRTLALACLAFLPWTAAGGEPSAAKDRFGDPLPAHVRVRMGTMRFRQGSSVHMLTFSPNGRILASLGFDSKLRLWDFPSGRELRAIAVPGNFVQANLTFTFTPDGKQLAAATGGTEILGWEVETGKSIKLLENLQFAVTGLSFSPDGKVLAVASNDAMIRLLDRAAGKELRQLQWKAAPPDPNKGPLLQALLELRDNLLGAGLLPGANGIFTAVAFSPDGKRIAAGGFTDNNQTGIAVVWDPATGKEMFRATGPQGGFQRLVWAPDGKHLAAISGQQQSVHIWDTAARKEVIYTLAKNGAQAQACEFAPDGKALALTINDEPLHLLDPVTGKVLRKVGQARQGLSAVAYAPDGKTLVVAGKSMLHRFDPATDKSLDAVEGHTATVGLVSLSVDGKTLVSYGLDQSVSTWDAATGRELRRFDLPNQAEAQTTLNGAALSPDGALLAVSMAKVDPNTQQQTESRIEVFDVAAGKALRKLTVPEGQVGRLKFAPGGAVLASVWQDGQVRLWEARSGKELHSIRFQERPENEAAAGGAPPGLAGDVTLAFSADGRLLLTRTLFAPDGDAVDPTDLSWQVRVWEVATGKERRKFTFKIVTDNPTVTYAGLGGPPGGVSEVAVEGREVRPVLAWSPNGKQFIQAGGSTIHLCDAVTGKEIRRFGGYLVAADIAVFSPNGQLLAAGSNEGEITLWDVATGSVLAQAAGHRGVVASVAFSADGKTLISGGGDTSALVWDVAGLLDDARPRPVVLDPIRLQALWNELADADAAKADRALVALASSPAETVALLKTKLRPQAVTVDADALAKLIADLDSSQYKVREQAMQKLEKLDRVAESALRKALAVRQPSLEVRRRVERILEKLEGPVTAIDKVQMLRAVELLEQLATPASRQLLQELTTGTPDAWLTQEAQAALARLNNR